MVGVRADKNITWLLEIEGELILRAELAQDRVQ